MTNNISGKIKDTQTSPSDKCCGLTHTGPDNYFRRDFVKYLALAIPVAKLSISNKLHAAQIKPERLPPQANDRLTYFSKSKRGQIIKFSDLGELDKPQLVLPYDVKNNIIRDDSRYNQILLQKLPTNKLSTDTKAMSVHGVVAYSAICPHAGCPVTGWMTEQENYMCPCHQSVFNPKDSGIVISGPAPRSLPALPLKIAGDEVVVAGNFNNWIGFGKRPK